jgi:pimeloyl-ACP methyl ester carboxylesterase
MKLRPNRSIVPGVIVALGVAFGAVASPVSTADEPGIPKSLGEAIRMERADALPRTSFYETPSLAATKPGTLLRHEMVTEYAIPAGATAVRILYHSLSAVGADVATSGVVLIPAGTAPPGGWPVIAWAHGTSGVARQCAPSLLRDLYYGDGGMMPMVGAGIAVVATDYHGLGTVGPHEYINKTAQGRDVIYSIPAARAAVPSLGRRWVVIGMSQGGLAAWSVAEMEATFHDPDYLGAISIAGAAPWKLILTAMGEPGSSVSYFLPYMAYGIKVRTPSFEPSDMLVGTSLKRYPAVTTKGCWYYAYASSQKDPPGPSLKPGWDGSGGAQRFFRENALGMAPIVGPLLVISGEADEAIPLAGQRATAKLACQHGVALSFRSYPGLEHDPTLEESTPDQLAWVRDRFAGKPFLSNCESLAP